MSTFFTVVLLALSILTSTIAAIPTISVKGAKLFANGQQFFIKGVAYQGTPSDPLTNVAQCNADATLMSTLGTNSIRVYHVSPYADHSGCMSIFASLGIYVWLDLDTFNTTITQDAPQWSVAQFYAFTQVLDAFHAYDNLAGFWIGNEVINTAAGSATAPYVKAAVADIKAYISTKDYRQIPIGYSAADIAELRPALQNYLACSSNQAHNIDFYGLNSYEWCGSSSYTTSGYANLQDISANYSLPIFFSETGCNVARPRTFKDQAAIFSPEMVGTWSGSIIYEWVQETNDYGLVSYPNSGVTGQPQAIQPDFGNLLGQWKALSPSGVAEVAYTPSIVAPACPAATGGWLVNGDVALPTLGAAVVNEVAASIRASVAASAKNSSPSLVATTATSATTAANIVTITDAATAITTATTLVGNAPISAASQTAIQTITKGAASTSPTDGSSKAQNGGMAPDPLSLGCRVLVFGIVVTLLL